jgi:CheY-like chemotaxis protein
MTLAAATTATPRTARIILAEDDDDLRWLIADELRKDGHEVIEVANGHALGALVTAHALYPLDDVIVISDIGLPGRTGLSVLQRQQGRPSPRFIFISGFGGADDLSSEALRLGAVAVISKPFELEELRRALAMALGGA